MSTKTKTKPKKKKRSPPKHYTTDEIIRALRENRGLVTKASKALGCNNQTIYNRINSVEKVKTALKEIREDLIDVAEDGLADHADAKEPWAIKMILNTIGFDRGYGDIHRVAPTDPTGKEEYGKDARNTLLSKLLPYLTSGNSEEEAEKTN